MSHSRSSPLLTETYAEIERRQAASLQTVRDYLRCPGFSDTGEGMPDSAATTLSFVRRLTPDARLVETAGFPVVFGRLRSRRPHARTLLVYGLYDVTPLLAEEWSVDPLEAPVVHASEVRLPPSLGRLLVGRGANNHRGPVLALILGLEAMLTAEGDVPCNVVFVIEGEEEIGSPSLAGFLDAQAHEIGPIDGVWLPCMAQNSGGIQVLRRAYKGALFAELECRGGEWGGTRDGRHVWAGHTPWLDAPLMTLIQAIASLYDADHRTAIDRLGAESVPPVAAHSPEVLELETAFRANPSGERHMREVFNIAHFRGGRPLADHLARYMLDTTINVQGVVGGYQGPTYYTLLPGRAAARLDLRFPPSLTPERLLELLRDHLDRRGFSAVRIRDARGYAGLGPLADAEDGLRTAAIRAAARLGVRTTVWPIANNCCPGALFQRLGRDSHAVPFSVAGLGHGDRAHAPDEFIQVQALESFMRFAATYLHEWADDLDEGPQPQPSLA